MGYIKQLSEDLIKKIAAGEVIERPASVVKELIENSIDAGATKVEIEIERSGKYIKVSDNGMGIDPSDIDLLFTRYATSKIKRFDDLWETNTLGFRGEALSSISAVSKITCKSKHINQEYGFEIKVIEGKFTKKSSAISIGTVFEIDDLFYNVPARQKFLKSEATELNYIYDIVLSHAISHPKISFTLINNKNVSLKSNGANDLKQTIIELLGEDLKDKMISISGKNHFVDLNGYISSLEIYRSDRKSIFIFINNRPVKCQIISKAIFSAYEGLLPPSKFPVVIVNFNFKPKFVDVNVHPTKKEVRYTNPNEVYNLVLHSIQDSISDYYKKGYKEKSVYSLPEHSHQSPPPSSYSEAAFNFYAKPEDKETRQTAGLNTSFQATSTSPSAGSGRATLIGTASSQQLLAVADSKLATALSNNDMLEQSTHIFSVNNLKCKLINSDKPIANITKIGNKTIFEVGSIFNENIQIIFNGEITGSEEYQRDFFNLLSNLSNEIYKTYISQDKLIQKKIINSSLKDEEQKEKKRKKPSNSLLYEIWERDHWTCVYCGKQLLDPKLVKDSMPNAKEAFVTYVNKEGAKITTHILKEHSASYDHYLPVSKLPQFNNEIENLYACCFECNRKKSDSMAQETWKPSRKNNWDKPLEIAGLCFNTSNSFHEISELPKI